MVPVRPHRFADIARESGTAAETSVRDFGPEAEPVRHPEPDVVVPDERLRHELRNTPIVRLYRGAPWADGSGPEHRPALSPAVRQPRRGRAPRLREDGRVSRRCRSLLLLSR